MRRGFLTCLVLATTLIPAACLAQGAAVMSPGGWKPAGVRNGITYFSCAAASCGHGSLVSYKQLQPGPLDSIADFRAKFAAVAAAMKGNPRSGVADVREIDLFQSDIATAKALTIVQQLKESTGAAQYMATSEISDGRARISVVSTAPSESAARKNLMVFQPISLLTFYLNKPKLAPR